MTELIQQEGLKRIHLRVPKIKNSDRNLVQTISKRNAVSPEFTPMSKRFRSIEQRVLTPNGEGKREDLDFSNCNFQKFDPHLVLNQTYARDTKKEFEYCIEKFGGNYVPDFGFNDIFDFHERTGWSRFSEIIQTNPANQNLTRTIKSLKGEKKFIEVIQNNKYKELLLENENILKLFVHDQLVRKSKASPEQLHQKKILNRHETKVAVSFITCYFLFI